MLCVRFLAIAVFMFFVPALALADTDGIVAKVGDVPIMNYELENHAARIMPFNVSFHGAVSDEKKEEILEKALSELILRAYKVCYANSLKLEAPEDQVKERIEEIRARFETEEAFNKAVSTETLDSFRASVRRELLAKVGEDFAVNSKVSISESQVRAYYEENKHTFFKPKQYRASHILIRVDPAATDEVRNELHKKAEGLMTQAKAGEDFYNLAYHNSEDRTSFIGGDMGVFHENQVVAPIQEALKKLKVDEISDIVETLVGYHVFQLTQIIEPKQMTLDEVRPTIRTKLEKQQRDTLYGEWMENLKLVYKVERFDS